MVRNISYPFVGGAIVGSIYGMLYLIGLCFHRFVPSWGQNVNDHLRIPMLGLFAVCVAIFLTVIGRGVIGPNGDRE